jgi:quercetin dioxygenase-like cupin family protein
MRPFLAALGVLALAVGSPAWAQQGLTSTPVLKSSTTVTGQPIEYPRTDKPEVVSVILEVAPGGEIGRHMHPIGGHVYVLDGALTLEVENGLRKEFRAGEAFVEPREQWHNARNTGDRPAKVLVVTYGEQGRPLTVRPAAGAAGATGTGTTASGSSDSAGSSSGAQPGASPR